MEIAILGGGSWGTALAMHLARKGNNVKIWEFFEEQAKEMQEQRVCKLLPEVRLPDNISVSAQMSEVLSGSELILLVVPSDKVGSTIESAKAFLEDQPVVICSKGFGENLELMTGLVGKMIKNDLFCLYGPTHAEEVGKGLFSGIVLAGEQEDQLLELQELFSSDNFKVETSKDVVGVQVAAALKNIVAVFAGVLDGMGLGDNSKAYMLVKGIAEIKQVGLKWGGKEDTFYGLAGLGDVIVTGTSQHSRNRYAGQEVGKGRKLDEVIAEMDMVAEGVTTIKEAIGLKKKFGLELPLITGLYEILFEEKDPQEVLIRI